MVRSIWMKGLLAALASTGLVLAQAPDRIITVQEAGKPAHKCKVLKSTPKGRGVTMLQVLDLETGEVMNLEESPDSIKIVPQTVAEPTTLPAATTTAKVMTVTEMGQQSKKANIQHAWTLKDGQKCYQVQLVDGGEILTIEETGPVTSMLGGSPVQAMSTRIHHWGKSTSAPKGVPVPPPEVLARDAARAKEEQIVKTSGTDKLVLPTADDRAKTEAKTEPARSKDWHDSLAKTNSEPVKPRATGVLADAASRSAKPADPLADPIQFTRPPVEHKLSSNDKAPAPLELAPPSMLPAPQVPRPMPMNPQQMAAAQAAMEESNAFADAPAHAPSRSNGMTTASQPNAFTAGKVTPAPATPLIPPVVLPNNPLPPTMAAPTPMQMPLPAGPSMNRAPAVLRTSAIQDAQPIASSHLPGVEPQLPERGTMTTDQLLMMMRNSLYPSQREWAADQLAHVDWKSHANVVDALTDCALHDQAATVRAGCVRCLAKMNVNTMPVVTALQSLKTDGDARVQNEVQQALAKLTAPRR